MPPTNMKENCKFVMDVSENKKCVEQQDGVDIQTCHSSEIQNGFHTLNTPKESRGTQMETSIHEKVGREIFRDMVFCGRRKCNVEKEGKDFIEPSLNERSPASIRLEELADHVLEKHYLIYKSMVKKLELEKDLNYGMLEIICDELFKDQHMSWGRIIALCAFCMEVSRECKQNKFDHVAVYIVDSVWHYNRNRISKWISELPRGWDTVEEVFPDNHKTENVVFKALLYAGLGLAAMASVIKVVR